jgi:hypothetical protein
MDTLATNQLAQMLSDPAKDSVSAKATCTDCLLEST